MAKWKTDPLLRAVLAEARALWAELDEAGRPELLRVELRSSDEGGSPDLDGHVDDVWLLDDSGLRLAPVLRREAHHPGDLRGAYAQFGLVRLSISKDHRLVALDFQLGPEVHGEIQYDVDGEGLELELFAQAGSPSA